MTPQKYIFPIMGLPSILQSDNGCEFVNQMIGAVCKSWPGQVQLVSGCPRHPSPRVGRASILYTGKDVKCKDSRTCCIITTMV